MVKFKKRISSVLAVLFTALACLSTVPVKAVEVTPEIVFVGVEHSPLVVGDTETFYVSSVGAEKVQYRVFQNKIGTDKWQELTPGYTSAANANEITSINGSAKYEAGKYKLSVWVKKADSEGKFKNTNGGYDSYYIAYLNCVSKDDNNRVYANGDMNVEKNSYVVGETVKVNGIKDISGMKAPYTYKLHIYDVNSNVWTLDKATYRDKDSITWVPSKAGTYVLDVWAMSSNSTLWAKEAQLNGRIYEAWKLKVITVKEKVEPTEINIVDKGTIYGSQVATNPMQINKNVNITANDVVLNNANIKGNVTITGDNATLNNVKIEGTLILNPGTKGTANINNVTVDNIKVLSGAQDSIHFNNVNAKTLNISSNSLVRVESKGTTKIGSTTVQTYAIIDSVSGSFGEIKVSITNLGNNQTQQVVELRGTFTEPIVMESGATLKAAEGSKIPNVVIAPVNNEKITLDGIFGQVEVNKPSTVATTTNTTIVQVTTNSTATLELAAGSKITTLDQKEHTIVQTGTGTVDVVQNPPVVVPPVVIPGGGPSPTTPIPASVDDFVTAFISLVPENSYITDITYKKPTILTRTLVVELNSDNDGLTLAELYNNEKGSDFSTLLLPYAALILAMNELDVNITTENGSVITDAQELIAFLKEKRDGTTLEGLTTLQLIEAVKEMSFAEIISFAKANRGENEGTASITVEGLDIIRVSALDEVIYDNTIEDIRLTVADFKNVFEGKAVADIPLMTQADLIGDYVVTAKINGKTVKFTLTLKYND